MISVLRRTLVFLLCFAIVAVGFPRRGSVQASPAGEQTADEAARLKRVETTRSVSAADAAARGEPVLAMGALGFTSAEPDTTEEFEFPDEGRKHLYRDITVWLIVSAFVAVFIVKVFIEDDSEPEPDNSPPGKTIP